MADDPIERIERLRELRDAGDITNAEYEAMKADVLGDVGKPGDEPESEHATEPSVLAPVHHSQKFCALKKQPIPRASQIANASCPLCGVPLPAKNRYVMVTYDSDGRVVSHENPPPPAWWKGKVGVALIAVVVVIGLGLFASTQEADSGGRDGPSVRPPPSACDGNVLYKIDGTARSVSITMQNRQGNTEQLDEVLLPFDQRIGNMPCGEFVYISAQNQGTSGSVTCRIAVDGLVVESATSSGEYVIATCSGSVPGS